MIEHPIRVINRLGLHARAAARVVDVAKTFGSTIRLRRFDEPDAKPVDAKSIMGVMMLAAPQNTKLVVTVEGEDETAADAAIDALFANRFGEDD